MKTQKAILLQTSLGKERLGDYSTSVVKIKSGNRSRVVSQSFFTTACQQQDSPLCFHPFLVSVLFSGPTLLELNFTENFLPLANFRSCIEV